MPNVKILAAGAALLSLAFAGCDSQVAPVATGPSAGSNRATILATLKLSASADGMVMNACGEPVEPHFIPAELGGKAGPAILFAMPGGPNTATCYGDGPDLHLMIREDAGWREIYAARGRMLIILPTATGGVRDIADGGPGLSFPVWTWNGTRYAPAGREVADAELANLGATYLP